MSGSRPAQRRRDTPAKGKRALLVRHNGVMTVLFACSMLLLSLVVTSTVWPAANAMLHGRLAYGYRAIPNPHPGLVHTGLLQWTGETQTKAPTMPVSPQAGLTVDPSFLSYFQRHGGAAQLGAPLTPSFVSSAGLTQFFANTALILAPTASPGMRGDAGTDEGAAASGDLGALIGEGIKDPQTSIVELPLLHSLLAVGSLATLAGSDMTYATLRAAADPSSRVVENAGVSSPDWVFVPEAPSGKQFAGHRVPVALWRFINDPTVSPDGWMTDVGPPLTEALSFTAVAGDGTLHHEVVQAFWQTAFVLDQDSLDASGNPLIQRLNLGHDYLATLGYPPAYVSPGTTAWVATAATVTAHPSGGALAHLGAHWLVTLTGPAQWLAGTLWYAVNWQAGNQTRSQEWLLASALTMTAPPAGLAGRGVASIDALSSTLASYLAQLGGDAGMAIFDVSRNQYYTFDDDDRYIMGSSAKVPIMLTYLNWVEQQGRGLSSDENWLMTTMIENSDNESAQTLYDNVGGDPAVNGFLDAIGVGSYIPNPDGWGWGEITPGQMVSLLYKLYSGQILTSQDRAYALSLMEDIESDQRNGVGVTAPAGATVAMKDGWLPGPDGLWAANSSGIVMLGNETYIISVYTAEQTDLNTNWAILNHVCGAVVPLLTPTARPAGR